MKVKGKRRLSYVSYATHESLRLLTPHTHLRLCPQPLLHSPTALPAQGLSVSSVGVLQRDPSQRRSTARLRSRIQGRETQPRGVPREEEGVAEGVNRSFSLRMGACNADQY